MSPELKKAINDIESSNFIVNILPLPTITKSKGYVTRNTDDGKIKQGSTLRYDYEKYQIIYNVKVPPEVVLAHELGHSHNLIKGEAENYVKKFASQQKNKWKQSVRKATKVN